LTSGLRSDDADLARYCAALLAIEGLWPTGALKGAGINPAVQILAVGLGLRRRLPASTGPLTLFFQTRMKIATAVNWKRALGKDLRDAENRCIRLQALEGGDPTTWVMMLDTFNEVLIQGLSNLNPTLHAAFVAMAKKKGKAVPDFGAWLRDRMLNCALPKSITWLQKVHAIRVKADLAHAKDQKTGRPTRPVSFPIRDALRRGCQISWAEIIRAFHALL
jgi:hypothetical protein